MQYGLVIFDCDGVLVDSEKIANHTFAAEVRKLGIPFTNEEAAANFPGTTLAKCIEYVERKFNVILPEDIGDKYRTASLKAFTRLLEPVPGVESIIQSLSIQACVASNGPKPKMLHNLALVKFLDYFQDNLFSAYEINKFKPDPGIFLHAANTLGVDPSACIVIEDSIHGVQAGLALGMKVLGYDPHGSQQRLADAEYFQSMNDISYRLNELGVIREDHIVD